MPERRNKKLPVVLVSVFVVLMILLYLLYPHRVYLKGNEYWRIYEAKLYTIVFVDVDNDGVFHEDEDDYHFYFLPFNLDDVY